MKKAIAVIAVVVVMLGAWAYLGERFYMNGSDAEYEEGRAYAEETMVAIMSAWDASALQQRASAELLKTRMGTEADVFCSRNTSMLGPLVQYGDIGGYARRYYTLTHGKLLRGDYSFDAEFQRLKAAVVVSVEKKSGSWKLAMLECRQKR